MEAVMQRDVATRLLLRVVGAAIVVGAMPGAVQASIPPSVYSTNGLTACSNLGQYVSVGGTAGFNTLVDADFTTALLATGHVRLYEHGVAVAAAITDSPPSNPYDILNSIENVFAGTGPGEAELGLLGPNYFTLPASYTGYYQYQYVASGLGPNAANVNVPFKPAGAIKYDKRNVKIWEAWVQAANSVGIATMAPIVAPNGVWKAGSPIYPPTRREYYDINSSFYALSRFEATYGGAIAFDSPSDFFLAGGSGPGYREFIEQAIQWGNAQGLRTTVLVSPLNRATFTKDTKRFVAELVAHNAVPSEWSVDDYEDTDPNDSAAMGPDTTRNTTTEVALWLATYAPVYTPLYSNGHRAGGTTCRPGM
jgi:hypothetical protein